jgi:molybdenum cofactor cytidylyltransferase
MAAQSICPLLLAAGQSRRFGSDKLLHVMSYQSERKPLIMHTLSAWLEVFSQVNVVVRDDNAALLDLLSKAAFSSRLRLIMSTNAHQGMAASLVSGIESNQDADSWLIGLADMPFIKPSVIAASSQALQAGARITQPEYRGRRGHPVGFSARFLPQLLTLTGDKGARDILTEHADDIMAIQSPDAGIYQDIDLLQHTL